MIAFLQLIEERYGGVEEYLAKFVGLTRDDIDTIRRNLLILKPSH